MVNNHEKVGIVRRLLLALYARGVQRVEIMPDHFGIGTKQERTGLAAEVYDDNIAVNSIAPGLVATPGAVHHNLITEENKDIQSPVEAIAEAVCYMCRTDPLKITGRVDQIKPFMDEFKLDPVPLIG